jgi:SAM-dependent methyltransferase
MDPNSESRAVKERFARRDRSLDARRYTPLAPWVYLAEQERERAFIRTFTKFGHHPVSDRALMEVGCGTGRNLLQLIRLGFAPEKIQGIELIPDRAREARRLLPAAVRIHEGDAATLPLPSSSFDIVMQSLVFSSLLDNRYQELLANRMWDWVCPGGGVLWYDFVFDNPANPDVRGVPSRRIDELFPEGRIRKWRVTLAPPVGRAVTQIAPALYGLLNMIPWLRTHLLCWIEKAR